MFEIQHFPDDPNFEKFRELVTDEPLTRVFEIVTRIPLTATSVCLCPVLPKPMSLSPFGPGHTNFPMTEIRAALAHSSSERHWVVTCRYGTDPPPLDTTTASNRNFRTKSVRLPPIDVRVGETTINGIPDSCAMVMRVGQQEIPFTKVVITLDMEKPPSITVEYIEK